MPLTLNVGIARKLGQPGYSSIGASCNLQVELENGLLGDPESLQSKIRQAYLACAKAVQNELDRLTTPEAAESVPSISPTTNHKDRSQDADRTQDRVNQGRRRPVRPATPAQVQAIRAIARDHGADLAGLLQDEYGVGRPEELSSAQASKLIDTLKAVASV